VGEAGGQLHRYPTGEGLLTQRLAGLHGVAPGRVVLSGTGVSGLLERTLRALCARGDEVVSPFPSYELLTALCAREGLRHRPVPADQLADGLFGPHRAGPLLAAVGPRTRVVYLATPDNPTGALCPPEEELALRRGLGPGVVLVIDEAWSLEAPRPADDGAGAPVVRLRSFSKLSGLAGLRAGYALAPAPLAGLLRRLELPFPLGTLQLAGVGAALDEPERARRTALLLVRERARTAAALRALGLTVSESPAPLLLLRDPQPGAGVGPLLFALRAAGAAVQEAHWDPAALVLALGERRENRRAVAAAARARGVGPDFSR
jgi:histidinol-phosphate aminotransferase